MIHKMNDDITPYDFMELQEPKHEICMRGSTNSHAQNTKRKKMEGDSPNLTALIDWLSVTFSLDYYNVDFVLTLLFKYLDLPYFSWISEKDNPKETIWQFDEVLEKGYSRSINYGHIRIFYDYVGTEKGIKLSLSGQGCREFELMLREGYTWFDFLQEVSELEVNFTRLDLAIDDFKGYFKVSDLIENAKQGNLRSKFKKWKPDGWHDTITGESLGDSIYIGSEKSRIFIRVYEKNMEQKMPDMVWNRTELQITNERADIAVDIIKQGNKHLAEYALGMLKQYVTFCDPYRKVNKDGTEERRIKPDDNRSRWQPAKWWEEFIHDCEKIKLTEMKPESNVETKRKWISDKVAKTIAISVLAEIDTDYNMNWLKSVINRGYLQLEEKDIALIRKHREDKKRASMKYGRQEEENIIDVSI